MILTVFYVGHSCSTLSGSHHAFLLLFSCGEVGPLPLGSISISMSIHQNHLPINPNASQDTRDGCGYPPPVSEAIAPWSCSLEFKIEFYRVVETQIGSPPC
ncbi:hypothetical protein V6Z93_004119 [Aspergillus fumigatus]|jgi:hypothetical protein